jgi:DNA replication and repair protein RecF
VHLARLALTDFRCYGDADVRFSAGVTTFTGPNGAGKTNLVEAAMYVATFASHRVATDAPLVRSGADRAILRAAVRSAGRDCLVEIELNTGRANRVRLNRAPLTRPRDALGTLRCVLFAPEDLAIVKGDPEQRRRYLDDLLVASRPRYAAVRADYERVVKQRTALLKSARADRAGRPAGPGFAPPALEVWDDQLIAAGAELTAGRLRLSRTLGPLITARYADVAGDQRTAAADYRLGGKASAASGDTGHPAFGPEDGPLDPDPAALAEYLRANLERLRRAELERGVCLVGPHRDELELRIGDLPARGYASHGESWSLALALRLAAFDLLRADGDDPVLLLDDVFAELDTGRRDRLAELAVGAEQVIVTAAVAADVPSLLTDGGASFTVRDGVISHA